MKRYTHPSTGDVYDLETGSLLTPCCKVFSSIESEVGFYCKKCGELVEPGYGDGSVLLAPEDYPDGHEPNPKSYESYREHPPGTVFRFELK